ncbi:MAG: aspartate aminotransferase family protein [Nitrospirae bacterium]|nr:aspartate aminotransferase family protein [Candidatus Troglogloeales bacterium]
MILEDQFHRYLCPTSARPIGLQVDHARGSYIYTKDKRKYLDFISGISVASIGHTHPAVVKAICQQAERYLHVMVYGEYIQEPQVNLAAKLCSLLPDSLSSVYFTNSGTEAVEGALKLSKKFTGRKRLIGFENSYHGDSHGSLSVTGRDIYRKPFYPLLPNVSFLPFNVTKSLMKIDQTVAAVITEPIQGEGGMIIPSKLFLQALRARCQKVGALLILDEAQTGLGRTGKRFAFEHFKIVPDILVLAKSLGGGMPLGAFIGSPAVMKRLSTNPPLSHVTTFGGHPVSCAAGLASLNIVLKKNLVQRAKKMGDTLRNALIGLAHQYPVIREARGFGLMIGLEFYDPEPCMQFVQKAREHGLLLGWTLHTNRVVRIAPPFTLSSQELKEGLAIMRRVLGSL